MKPRSPHGPILVGYDGSDESRDALAFAKTLAAAFRRPVLLAWIEPVAPLDLPSEMLRPIQERAEGALDEVARSLREQGFEVDTHVGLLGSVAQGIHELAERASASVVVVGSSHRDPVGRVLAGTVGTRLLHGSPCPVAIAPRGVADKGKARLTRIGVGYDGSPESQLALSWAEKLAQSACANLRLFVVSDDHSTDLIDIGREKRCRADHILAEGLDRVTNVQASGVVKSGLPLERLAHHSQHVDLLVVGSRGYGPLRRVLLGSVSAHLVGHSKCPVVVTPRAAVEHQKTVPAGVVSA